jgi:hypothetical protein
MLGYSLQEVFNWAVLIGGGLFVLCGALYGLAMLFGVLMGALRGELSRVERWFFGLGAAAAVLYFLGYDMHAMGAAGIAIGISVGSDFERDDSAARKEREDAREAAFRERLAAGRDRADRAP